MVAAAGAERGGWIARARLATWACPGTPDIEPSNCDALCLLASRPALIYVWSRRELRTSTVRVSADCDPAKGANFATRRSRSEQTAAAAHNDATVSWQWFDFISCESDGSDFSTLTYANRLVKKQSAARELRKEENPELQHLERWIRSERVRWRCVCLLCWPTKLFVLKISFKWSLHCFINNGWQWLNLWRYW